MKSERNNPSCMPSTFRTNMSNTGPTIISAVSKLKEESDRLLRQHKRYIVLNHHITRESMSELNKSKRHMFMNEVKQSANYDKEVKKQIQRKKIEEIKLRYSINLKNRDKNKKMIEDIRKSYHNANHQLYQKIRQKKKADQEQVKMKRSFFLQSRTINRKKLSAEKDKRKQSIQNFHQSRILSCRQQKEEEIQDLLRKSQDRHRFYEALSSRNSRIREERLSNSRSLSNKSLQNPQKLGSQL